MLRCVTRPPARRQGPTPFHKIQVSDLLDLQILAVVLPLYVRGSNNTTYSTITNYYGTIRLPKRIETYSKTLVL